MAWTSPRTWVSGELVTASLQNVQVRDNLSAIDTFVGGQNLTDGGILLGSGTGAITALAAAANGQIPIGDGAGDPQLATITGTADQLTVTNGAASITLSLAIGDYEVGTFVPTYYGSTTGAAHASKVNGTGRYTRIGRTVTVSVYFNGVAVGAATGNAQIGSFPNNIAVASAIAAPQQHNLPVTGAYNTIYLSGSIASIYTNANNAGWALEAVRASQTIYLSFTATFEFA